MKYILQTTKGPISISSESYDSACDTATSVLGYTLTQDSIPEPEPIPETPTQYAYLNQGEARERCEACSVPAVLATLDYFGRKLRLCPDCYRTEQAKQTTREVLADYKCTLAEKIEVTARKRFDNSISTAIELYNAERPAWILANFDSPEDMRDKLIEFITSLENLVFKSKNKLRAAYDAARELDASLSKSERDALINDPNFKAPENKEFKAKIKKGNKEQQARNALKGLGFTDEQIDKELAKS